MSMTACDFCPRLIDSDDDPGCFVEVGNMRAQTKDAVMCEPCRDQRQADDGTTNIYPDYIAAGAGGMK